jgi:ABC-type phosphate/phosphonate transport system substrate-binding protein
MTAFIANARMYAVTPAVEALWRDLFTHVFADAEVAFDYLPYPAPQPLEHLWARGDLGCVFMCGYPIALDLAAVVPIAAPIPALDWAAGRPVYRSDLIVRADSPYHRLEDTFGTTTGWTVAHSHSGMNAWRHHLLRYRSPARPTLYHHSIGDLVTARRILDAVRDGTITIGPLDAYWHALIRRHAPDLTQDIRVLDATDVAPIPALVASPALPPATHARLAGAFAAAASRPWFAGLAEPLQLAGFAPVTKTEFSVTLAWDQAATAAGYPVPA